MGCHAEFLRVALEGHDALSRAVLREPHAVATRWHEPRIQMLAQLATTVTLEPWLLSASVLARARAIELSDDDLLHAIALSSFFGHLNRIADATAVALDYAVQLAPLPPEPATPPLACAPHRVTGTAPLSLESRPATAAALSTWRDYLLARDARNAELEAFAAQLVGDGPPVAGSIDDSIDDSTGAGAEPLDEQAARRQLAELVIRAPWRLGDVTFAPLRSLGYDDAAVFAVCAAASSFGAMARIRVALTALSR